MKRQPTQVEEKPKANMELHRQKKRPRPAVPDFDYEDGDPPINIDLQKKIDLLDLIEFPFEIEDYDEFKYLKCLICDQIGKHTTLCCPYLELFPHDVTLPPGIDRHCKCCDKIGGHPGQEWVGYALPMRCRDCNIRGEHRTGDSDCPAKGALRETAPSETILTENATPSETAPSETVPTETATPSEIAPSETVPTETASPSETAPRETVPTETASPSRDCFM